MQMPSAAAMGIVEQFSWSSNVIRDGKMIGQQYIVAEAIDKAIAEKQAEIDRLRTAVFETLNELGKSLRDRRVLKSRIKWIAKNLSEVYGGH